MSHDQHDSQANRPSSPDYYATSPYELSPGPPSSTDTVADQDSPPMRDSGLPIPLKRWAAGARDSQLNASAGAIGGFTSGIVTCPLDVIKTKLQAQGGYTHLEIRHAGHPKLYNGLVGTARVIWAEEGIRGMYRGLGPIVLGYLPTWAVWFTIYNESKKVLHEYSDSTHVINFWSSIIAGASSTIATNPIWVIKTRLMSQSVNYSRGRHPSSLYPKTGNTPTARPTLPAPWHYRSTIDAARKMYTSEGMASFYSGLTPALLGLSHVAVQFPTYEFLKTTFTGQGMGESPAPGEPQKLHWTGILSASILSKILASSATYPHEVIRTRLQTQRRPVAGEHFLQGMGITGAEAPKPASPRYKGIVTTFRTILREEGWRAFYAGLGTNMTRAVPAATVTMLTYEFVMERLNLAKEEGKALMAGDEDARL